MFEDVDNEFEESPPPEESDNRTFLIAAGILGGITLLALVCMAAYVLLIAPGERNQRSEQLTAIAAQNTEAALVARAQTQTASAPTATQIPTSTGTATSSPTPVVVQATATRSVTLDTTADLTPDLIAAIASISPQLLDDLTEEMLLAMSTEVLEALPENFLAGLAADLRARIEARLNLPDPVELPDSWTQAAAEGGDTIETTDDLTLTVITENELFAPALLEDLTPEMLLAMPVEVLEQLPDEYVAGLDPVLQARIDLITNPPDPNEPVDLPDSWTQAAAEGGDTVETTDDLTVPIITENELFAPALLEDLTPEMLLALPVEVLEQLPDDYVAGLDPVLQAQIDLRINPPDPDREPVDLPDSWTQAAAEGGDTVETTDDLTVPIIIENELFDQALLDELTPEMLLAMPIEVLEQLPDEYVAGLEALLQTQIDLIINPPDPNPEPVDLPASWADAAIQLTAAPTVGPRTATVAALLTQAAQQTATVIPTATALPGTGFADDVGAPSLLALAALFIVVIFLARRLRRANA